MTALVVDDDPVARALIETFVTRHPALTLVGTCTDAI
ncbi:MAG TPA: DNA-binding response regulator, partial [Rhodothermales bacterium]|nr:DNA-binding response regulator [Rhodothermales bacterium]